MSLRFKAGEMAIVAADISGNGCEGSTVEILEVGPFIGLKSGKVYDYVTSSPRPDWPTAYCWDIELRKIDPPEEPVSMHREETIEEEAPA